MNIQSSEPTGGYEPSIKLSSKEMFNKVEGSRAKIVFDKSDLWIDLPFDCSIGGQIYDTDKGKEMNVLGFEVNQKLRNHGIGSRLLRILTAEAVGLGVATLKGSPMTEAALRTRGRVFGRENIIFLDENNEPLGISFEEAVERINEDNYILNEGKQLSFKVDLRTIDTKSWERAELAQDQ